MNTKLSSTFAFLCVLLKDYHYVDTINKIINIQTGYKIDYIPKEITSEITLQTEKQVTQTIKV